MSVLILAIESSCDDTSASVIQDGEVLSNCIANQEIHKLYGGVVPEAASRAHQVNIVPVVDAAIKKAGIKKENLSAIAFTRGPGLIGSLLVGVSFAKAFAMSLEIPMIEVNHMQAHILAHYAEEPKPPLPFLCLTVSGGHTQIVKVTDHLKMELLGSTIDDAAGEAFDKTGKLLGLDYPAGPLIDKYAKLGEPIFKFTEPKVGELDFSFSGLKTSILYFLRKNIKENPKFIEENLNDICASVQARIVSILLKKLKIAAQKTGIKHLAIAGGVSANSEVRDKLKQNSEKYGWRIHIPKLSYTTDNAAMIAITGQLKFESELFSDFETSANPRLKI